MSKENLLFLINPISGGKSKKKIVPAIQQYLDTSAFNYEIVMTAYPGHASEILQERKDTEETIIAVGGDGSINEIAKVLAGTSKAMGIIPQGSGNGLARHLGISLNPVKAIQQLNTSVKRAIDTAYVNGHFFVSIAGVGFDSLIAQKFTSSKSRGFLGYAGLVFREYFKYKPTQYQLILDGKPIKRNAALISFANSNQFGYNTRIAPAASLEDGLLDVCIMRKPSFYQLPGTFFKVWTGKSDQSAYLEIIRAKSIILQDNNYTFANIDGESVEVGEKLVIDVNPASLHIKIPHHG